MAGFDDLAPEELADAWRQFVSASSVEDVQRAADGLQRYPQHVFSEWTTTVLPTLEADLREYFDAYPREWTPQDPAFGVHVHRWNALGIWAGLAGEYGLSRVLYERLLTALREWQHDIGTRVPKGTPYHQLGWIRLVADPSDPDALTYFRLAAVEDVLSDAGPDTPALTTLRTVYGWTPSDIESLVVAARPVELPATLAKVLEHNPELALMFGIPTRELDDRRDAE